MQITTTFYDQAKKLECTLTIITLRSTHKTMESYEETYTRGMVMNLIL